jgi:hypothetical protein
LVPARPDKSRTLKFLDFGHFFPCCGLPFHHGVGHGVPINDATLDGFAETRSVTIDRAFRVFLPASGVGEPGEGSVVSVDVQFLHLELHQLTVSTLDFCSIGPCCLKRGFELGPQNLVVLSDASWFSRVRPFFELYVASVNPVFD